MEPCPQYHPGHQAGLGSGPGKHAASSKVSSLVGRRLCSLPHSGFSPDPDFPASPWASPHGPARCWLLLHCLPTACSLQASPSLLPASPRPHSPSFLPSLRCSDGAAGFRCVRSMCSCVPLPQPSSLSSCTFPSHTPLSLACSCFWLHLLLTFSWLLPASPAVPPHSLPPAPVSPSPVFCSSFLPFLPRLSHSCPSLFLFLVIQLDCSQFSLLSFHIHLLSTYHVPGSMPVPPLTGLIAQWGQKLTRRGTIG